MVDTQAGRKSRSWLWALLAAAVLLAIAAWFINQGYQKAHTEALAADAQADPTGVDTGTPRPPEPSAAATAPEGDATGARAAPQ